MCGTEGKECAICRFGDGGCLTAMYEDDFCLATKNQIIKRLNDNRYPHYRQVMINTLNTEFNHIYVNGETIIEEYPSQTYCCENKILLERDESGKTQHEKMCEKMKGVIDIRNTEDAHIEADHILCEFLESLGFDELVKLYRKVDKWYS